MMTNEEAMTKTSIRNCGDCIHCEMCKWINDMVGDNTCDWFKEYREHSTSDRPKGVWDHVIDCPTNNKLAWFSCSNCNAMEKLDKDDIKAKYCWNCGAYMGVDNK